MVVVLVVHLLLVMLLVSYRPQNDRSEHRGEQGGEPMRVSFLPLKAELPAPPPPPPPPPPPLPHVPEPATTAPAMVPAMIQADAVVAAESDAGLLQSGDDGEDGGLLFVTAEPTIVEEVPLGGVRIYSEGDSLPAEFVSNVDTSPHELAQYRQTQSPQYLEAAHRARQQGTVVLRVLVDELGFPVGVQVLRSDAGDLLVQETIRAVSGWQFKPAMKDGAPVKSTILVPIAFHLDGVPSKLKKLLGRVKRP